MHEDGERNYMMAGSDFQKTTAPASLFAVRGDISERKLYGRGPPNRICAGNENFACWNLLDDKFVFARVRFIPNDLIPAAAKLE